MEKTTYIALSENQELREMQKKSSSTNTLLTPDQLLVKHPYAKKIGWTPENIEFLYNEKLLKGEMKQTLMILNESFEKLLEFHKKQQELE